MVPNIFKYSTYVQSFMLFDDLYEKNIIIPLNMFLNIMLDTNLFFPHRIPQITFHTKFCTYIEHLGYVYFHFKRMFWNILLFLWISHLTRNIWALGAVFEILLVRILLSWCIKLIRLSVSTVILMKFFT